MVLLPPVVLIQSHSIEKSSQDIPTNVNDIKIIMIIFIFLDIKIRQNVRMFNSSKQNSDGPSKIMGNLSHKHFFLPLRVSKLMSYKARANKWTRTENLCIL